MSNAQIDIVRRLYESGMAPDVVAEIVSDDLIFDITPGFPEGGIFHGWPDATANFFGRLGPRLASLAPIIEDVHADGERVFVEGHYHAVGHAGDERDVRFVHAWTVADGLLVRLRQAADSHVLWEIVDQQG